MYLQSPSKNRVTIMLAGGAVYDSFAIRILKSYSSNDCSFKAVDTEKLWTEWESVNSLYFASKDRPKFMVLWSGLSMLHWGLGPGWEMLGLLATTLKSEGKLSIHSLTEMVSLGALMPIAPIYRCYVIRRCEFKILANIPPPHTVLALFDVSMSCP